MDNTVDKALGVASENNIYERHVGDVVVYSVYVSFDYSNAATIVVMLDAKIQQGHHKFLINLTECEFICSMGIGCLLKCFKLIEQAKGNLIYVGVKGNLRSAFNSCGLDEIFILMDSEEQALRIYEHGTKINEPRIIDSKVAPKEHICERLVGYVVIFNVSGLIEYPIENKLRGELLDRLESKIKSHKLKYVLNVSEVTFLDSNGIYCLMKCLKMIEQAKGKLILVGFTKEMRNTFERLELDKLFVFMETEEQAILKINERPAK